LRYWFRNGGNGDFSGPQPNDINFEIQLEFGVDDPITIRAYGGYGGWIENLDGTITWNPTWTVVASDSLTSVSNTFTDTVTVPAVPAVRPPYYTDATWTLDIGGTWSITFPTDEYVEILTGGFPNLWRCGVE